MTTLAKVLLSRDIKRSDILYLPHSRSGRPVQFLLREHAIEELLDISTELTQSIILDQGIISSAPLLLATPYDARFLLIGHLSRRVGAEKNFVESDELLEGLPPRIHSILEPIVPDICEALDRQYWRFSLEKSLTVLDAKVAALSKLLPTTVLLKLPDDGSVVGLAKTKAALDLVSSYLPSTIALALASRHDFGPLDALEKAQTHDAMVDPMEFVKRKDVDGSWDDTTSKPALKKSRSSGVDKLAKVNTKGMKQLTSFFKAKPAKP